MEVYVYSFRDSNGDEDGSYTTQDYEEAKKYAVRTKQMVICNEFEFADSYMVDDFTGNNDE